MNIIVNGGTKGIGREIVLKFSSEKQNRIIVTGRDRKALSEIASMAEHKNVIPLFIDLEEFDKQQDEIIRMITGWFKETDILINNAGMLVSSDFMKFSNTEARRIMEVNFFGPASLIRGMVPFMAQGSHIINISSMGGFQGSSKYRGLSYYSASKAALACLSECLAGELTDNRIFVNCLALGSVQTEMLRKAFPGYKAPVSAKEMAEFIVDFALNGNKYFNGKVIPVALNNP